MKKYFLLLLLLVIFLPRVTLAAPVSLVNAKPVYGSVTSGGYLMLVIPSGLTAVECYEGNILDSNRRCSGSSGNPVTYSLIMSLEPVYNDCLLNNNWECKTFTYTIFNEQNGETEFTPAFYFNVYRSTSGYWTIDIPVSIVSDTFVNDDFLNRLPRFITRTTLTKSLISDNGSDVAIVSGNFFLPSNSLVDAIATGTLNFGTTRATDLIFGRPGQMMVVNSKLGVATSSPSHMLDVNGDFFANSLEILPGGLGVDTLTSGPLLIGASIASAVSIGRNSATTSIVGSLSAGMVTASKLHTVVNCSTITSPANCGTASSGSVAMATGVSTLVVNTSAVTANSQILITEDSSLGTRLGVTCNIGTGRTYRISARTSGVDFTIRSNTNPSTNRACLSYLIIN